MWAQNLVSAGWTQRTVAQFPLCLAPSTLYAYNRVVKKFASYCNDHELCFPPLQTSVVADFLCSIADNSETPRAQLKLAAAALGHVYKSFGVYNVIDNEYVQLLITALVKSGTRKPMAKSNVMPIQPFRDLFLSWPSNEHLCIKDLRLKTISLLALTLMLRPSDIAPKTVQFDSKTMNQQSWLFTTDNVTFLASGEAKIVFHGIKNDTSRSGFEVILQPVQDRRLNPVQTLRDYIARTSEQRPKQNPVFLALTPPYGPIAARTVAGVMNEAIDLAGLSGQGFSAKSFRPTGATLAVETGCDPEVAMRLGRWKTRSVFYDHYVHAKPPETLSENILLHD